MAEDLSSLLCFLRNPMADLKFEKPVEISRDACGKAAENAVNSLLSQLSSKTRTKTSVSERGLGALMARIYRPYFDPEYETLSIRINPPRVSVDNTSCEDCTVVKVDSVNRPGVLLEVVQILMDLDLTITKAYISSDGGWFMDVFHVTDQEGNKVTEKSTNDYIEMGPKRYWYTPQQYCMW